MPVLAVGTGGGPFTADTMSHAVPGEISSVSLDGVGHYVAMEAPGELSRPATITHIPAEPFGQVEPRAAAVVGGRPLESGCGRGCEELTQARDSRAR